MMLGQRRRCRLGNPFTRNAYPLFPLELASKSSELTNYDIIELHNTEPTTSAIVIGDLNGDGYDDLVIGVGYYSYSTNKIFLNDGNDNFAYSLDFGGEHETMCIVLGDLDGDGLIDIIEGNASQPNYVYMNNGDSTFDKVVLPGGDENTLGAAIGDVNNDGYLDILFVNEYTSPIMLLNKEDATFEVVDLEFVLDKVTRVRCVAMGDMNNDGSVDLILGSDYGPNLIIFNYDGNLQKSKELPDCGDETFSLAVADINGDGKKDILCGNGKYYGGTLL